MSWFQENCPRLAKAHSERAWERRYGISYEKGQWVRAMVSISRAGMRLSEAMEKLRIAASRGRLR